MDTILKYIEPNIYGFLMLLAGIAGRYIIGKRRFNRRGVGGLQHFSSYPKAVAITFLEWLFQWVAIALIILGIFLLIKW